MTQADEPQPRDIALEQATPELVEELEEKSAPEESTDTEGRR